jgi:hypothetical protein
MVVFDERQPSKAPHRLAPVGCAADSHAMVWMLGDGENTCRCFIPENMLPPQFSSERLSTCCFDDANLALCFHLILAEDGAPENDGDDAAESSGAPKRNKIRIEYLEDKSKRHITFSKR